LILAQKQKKEKKKKFLLSRQRLLDKLCRRHRRRRHKFDIFLIAKNSIIFICIIKWQQNDQEKLKTKINF